VACELENECKNICKIVISNFRNMLKHNLLMIIRNFRRFRSTFLINLLGLSSGLACALLIYLWVADEISMDKFHDNDARLLQVMQNEERTSGIQTSESTPHLLAETLAEEIPEIEYAASVTNADWHMSINYEDKDFSGVGLFASPDYFNIFSWNLLHGNKDFVLKEKNAVVISKDFAMKLFNTTENVVGRAFEWKFSDFKSTAEVAGIFENQPSNTSRKFDMVLNYELFKQIIVEKYQLRFGWYMTSPFTYVVLKEGADIIAFNEKIKDFIKLKNPNLKTELISRRYSDAYLYGKYENGIQVGGRIEYVKLFSIVAIFIIVIASINFMNLSTAKAMRRTKEVGIKKALGAGRKTLISQYLGESLLMTLISMLFAITIVQSILPNFNELTGKNLVLVFDLRLSMALMLILISTGLLAGSYPALYLSGFNAVSVLKGKTSTPASSISVRKTLVVFQFMVSLILIVSVFVVSEQVDYVQSKNLGYSKDNIIWFSKEGKVAESTETFLNELRLIPGVKNASSTMHNMMNRPSKTELIWEGKDPDDNTLFSFIYADEHVFETLGIEMLEGRTFIPQTDLNSKVILNEAALEKIAYQDPIGKKAGSMEIIGIVKNFHFESLHEPIKPLIFMYNPTWTENIMVKIEAGKESEVIAHLSKFYKEFNPGYIFNFKFLDDDYQSLYIAERRVGVLSRYFGGLAILISCLGLFGLAAFTAERRTKEIGIRKVMGASVFGIIRLLSADFTRLVIISVAIGLPVSYFTSSKWLENFAFRIDLEWWYFATAGLLVLLITWLTVGYHAAKAARVNPSECLRDE
jgi:putative ABC transport system permease protein